MTIAEFNAISNLWQRIGDIREALDGSNQVQWVIPIDHNRYIPSYKIDSAYPELQAKIKGILDNANSEINLLLQQELKRLEAIISEIKIKPSIELIDK